MTPNAAEHQPTLTQTAVTQIAVTETDHRVLKRLRRIEGQVRGLQRMIEEGRDCHDILIQLSGVRSALDAAGDQMLEQYASGCRACPGEAVTPQDVVRAVKLLRG
ncbi:metal-sensing transcriptional repressor [Deinococcus frigens]|uniref:metal-sensitive transcriptional regulator n=1 Tax=Deinococcus frigens TaxID=249403 RepID=UPI000A7992A9|nr:metal-sensitive transcriptional regulator [Deinococcus frigens]